jgi:hypothetical protein
MSVAKHANISKKIRIPNALRSILSLVFLLAWSLNITKLLVVSQMQSYYPDFIPLHRNKSTRNEVVPRKVVLKGQ